MKIHNPFELYDSHNFSTIDICIKLNKKKNDKLLKMYHTWKGQIFTYKLDNYSWYCIARIMRYYVKYSYLQTKWVNELNVIIYNYTK